MRKLATIIDAINSAIGRAAAWLVLVMVLVQFAVVIMRYAFGIGSLQMQEAIVYMHGILFMLAAADTFLRDEHVRIDIFYARRTDRQKNIINALGGALLLLPFCLLILLVSFDYVALAWSVREGSRETSGIQAIYLLKTIILIFAAQLGLQAVSQIIKSTTDA